MLRLAAERRTCRTIRPDALMESWRATCSSELRVSPSPPAAGRIVIVFWPKLFHHLHPFVVMADLFPRRRLPIAVPPVEPDRPRRRMEPDRAQPGLRPRLLQPLEQLRPDPAPLAAG